ncbi:hypothetical protein K432DRAFT_132018 [Lepidopterella palustris CBS 459.81]|uniref:Uncharacterized protein n=1 Tax=Lepidopterella palustris CBS 459.81 TaxID=1314670 RepID=A0A8E2JC10_9PEZI|nr:hypothetical protein K432DRAFT_132018 [Lepidopterella palustris CBS 459.81]
MLRTTPSHVDFLILGAGWTSTFLLPLLTTSQITHAATTTTGHDNTIPFRFNPASHDTAPYSRLPSAKTVLITFPLTGPGQSRLLTSLYRQVHGDENYWIQLGSTGIFNQNEDWNDDDSPYDSSNPRAIAEDELRACVGGCVLNLAGLYGGTRVPRNWLSRIAKSKEDVKAKKAVHFIHGADVARAIVAAHGQMTFGKRWILADLRVYDWWDLIQSWDRETDEERKKRGNYAKWVGELMVEDGVRALPRPVEELGRKLDSRGFWECMGIWPSQGRLD